MSDNDLITFSDDDELISFKEDITEEKSLQDDKQVWNILIVDDEPEIHRMTKMVLRDYRFKNRSLSITSAYSRREAIEILSKENDIALILLDVVMESDDAGLLCVKDIREKLKNHSVRIILRTGQPGQAPEQKVIVDYDINDYKLKTEITSQKLFTSVVSSLRTYHHIKILNRSRVGLERIIEGVGSLYDYKSFSLFASGILEQLISILQLEDDSFYLKFSSLSAYLDESGDDYQIVAATGDFAGKEKINLCEAISDPLRSNLLKAIKDKSSSFDDNSYIGFFETATGGHTLLYLSCHSELCDTDKNLISLFIKNVSTVFEHISNNKKP
ncbi:MAG: DUF3369 domain-containing protein [Spirochaetaceae bacterium]